MKHLVFDFDGTLVDSMGNYSKMLYAILDEHNVSYGKDIIKTITPLGTEGTIKYLIEIGVKLTPQQIVKKMYEYTVSGYHNHIPAKSNVKKVLETLRSKGYHLSVLTAAHHDVLDPCLKRLELYNLFENVWTCDDFGTTKSDPKTYLQLINRLNAPASDIIFFDDNLHATSAAKTAGLNTCGVFDLSSADAKEQMIKQNDYYIDDFIELLDINF